MYSLPILLGGWCQVDGHPLNRGYPERCGIEFKMEDTVALEMGSGTNSAEHPAGRLAIGFFHPLFQQIVR